MKPARFTLTVTILGCLAACAMTNGGQRADDLEGRLRLLAQKLQFAAIQRIEILHVPIDTQTRIPMSAEKLEKSFTSKLILTDWRTAKSYGDLVSALEKAKVNRAPGDFDYRSAIIFYGQGGTRELAIFFDKTGRQASIDHVSVALDKGLYNWLSSNYLDCLR